MHSTKSEKTNYKVPPEHLGRYAHTNGTFASGNMKGKVYADESQASTLLGTMQVEDCQNRILILETFPPTPICQFEFPLLLFQLP
jgi:hypothetical protein